MKLRIWKTLSLAMPLATFATVTTAAVSPLQARDEVQELSEEIEEGVHAEEPGHHGALTLHTILTGEESVQFWGSVVNFLLLVYLLRRLGKKPLDAFLSSRRAGIERGISEAAEVKRAAEQAYSTYTERMKTLDSELSKLRKDVAEAAERDRARIVNEANESVARLKAETDTLVKRQAEQLQVQIRREVVSAAAEAAEKAVRELTTPEDQQRLAEAFMRELGKLADQAEEKRA